MNLYVYRINDHEYGAGLGLEECKRLGTIVEQWPLNTLEQAKFVVAHGTSYHGASDQVSRIADLVHELMKLDSTFRSAPEVVPAKPTEIQQPIAKPNLFQRVLSWCYAR